jgi:hypothetical protein
VDMVLRDLEVVAVEVDDLLCGLEVVVRDVDDDVDLESGFEVRVDIVLGGLDVVTADADVVVWMLEMDLEVVSFEC